MNKKIDKKLIIDVVRTCSACPAQWEAKTNKGEKVYVRYRWGRLEVSINDVRVFEKVVGNEYSGTMEFDELRRHTHHLFVWPSFERFGNAL